MIVKNRSEISKSIEDGLELRKEVLKEVQIALKRINTTPSLKQNQNQLLQEFRFLHEKMHKTKTDDGKPVFTDAFIFEKIYQPAIKKQWIPSSVIPLRFQNPIRESDEWENWEYQQKINRALRKESISFASYYQKEAQEISKQLKLPQESASLLAAVLSNGLTLSNSLGRAIQISSLDELLRRIIGVLSPLDATFARQVAAGFQVSYMESDLFSYLSEKNAHMTGELLSSLLAGAFLLADISSLEIDEQRYKIEIRKSNLIACSYQHESKYQQALRRNDVNTAFNCSFMIICRFLEEASQRIGTLLGKNEAIVVFEKQVGADSVGELPALDERNDMAILEYVYEWPEHPNIEGYQFLIGQSLGELYNATMASREFLIADIEIGLKDDSLWVYAEESFKKLSNEVYFYTSKVLFPNRKIAKLKKEFRSQLSAAMAVRLDGRRLSKSSLPALLLMAKRYDLNPLLAQLRADNQSMELYALLKDKKISLEKISSFSTLHHILALAMERTKILSDSLKRASYLTGSDNIYLRTLSQNIDQDKLAENLSLIDSNLMEIFA